MYIAHRKPHASDTKVLLINGTVRQFDNLFCSPAFFVHLFTAK